jgi:hypothetical protein
MPAARANSSAARCGVEPLPGVAKEIEPGLALAAAISWRSSVGRVRAGGDDDRHAAYERDGDQVLLGVKGRRLVQRHVGGQRIGRHQQGVAVGRGVDDGLHRDVGASARFVLDDEGLAQAGRQALGHGAGDDVDSAAGAPVCLMMPAKRVDSDWMYWLNCSRVA